ncbi:chorismate mutase [Salinibacillus xinjiangensis]|uniref:chorismate mutase n=1 Tax=Salinibacillus xinjiangensis TaxID=1229268 RepID=A0A6G1X690_9BACI|nr:chorismate mutase [Salinibacillus xinjiangensis]MRG86400.1 chorismate mutase [Salinibacillus xinjiangensis]
MIRGIRGATTVSENKAEDIHQATKHLLIDVAEKNDILPEDIVSVLISVTPDLTAAFPAKGMRLIDGWTYVPVMCTTEIPVPNALEKCIRVMVTAQTDLKQKDVTHIYHREAKQLRPDLVK